MSSALLLSALSCLVALLFSAAMALGGGGMAPFARWLLSAMVTLVAFGMTAYLGLFVMDGDQSKLLMACQLTRGQIVWLALMGASLLAPATLLADTLSAFLPPAESSGAAPTLFILTLFKSALLAPVLEELFFRGYLQGALARFGKGRAIVVSSLVFALSHGLSLSAFLPRVLLGLLFGLMMDRTGSLLAPMLLHGCYNAALVIAAYSGLAPLFSGLTLAGCTLRVLLSLVCLYAFRRAYTARGLKKPMAPLSSLRLTKKEIAFMALSLLLTVISEVLA